MDEGARKMMDKEEKKKPENKLINNTHKRKDQTVNKERERERWEDGRTG